MWYIHLRDTAKKSMVKEPQGDRCHTLSRVFSQNIMSGKPMQMHISQFILIQESVL